MSLDLSFRRASSKSVVSLSLLFVFTMAFGVACQNKKKDDSTEGSQTQASVAWASEFAKVDTEKVILSCRFKAAEGLYYYYSFKPGSKAAVQAPAKDSKENSVKISNFADAVFVTETHQFANSEQTLKKLSEFPVMLEITPTGAASVYASAATQDTIKITSDKSKAVPAEYADLKDKDTFFKILVAGAEGVYKLNNKIPDGVKEGTKLECSTGSELAKACAKAKAAADAKT